MMITCPKCSNKFPLESGFCNVCTDRESIKPEQFKIQVNKAADETPKAPYREVPNASSARRPRYKLSFFSAPVAIIGLSLALVTAVFLFNSWKDSLHSDQSAELGSAAGRWLVVGDPFYDPVGSAEKIDALCQRNFQIDSSRVSDKQKYIAACKKAFFSAQTTKN